MQVPRDQRLLERDVRELGLQPFQAVPVVPRREELVDRPRGVLRAAVARPEPSVHALPELQHALRHHVARAVRELVRPDERAHVRPRRWRVAHHAAHGRHALAARLAHGLMELVRRHVIAYHVPRRRRLTVIAAEPFGHLVGRRVPPDPLERVRGQQLGHRAGQQHLRPQPQTTTSVVCAAPAAERVLPASPPSSVSLRGPVSTRRRRPLF